jgi:hypothetical protein
MYIFLVLFMPNSSMHILYRNKIAFKETSYISGKIICTGSNYTAQSHGVVLSFNNDLIC